MKEKLISVIIPVYNVEKYLRQCLDSVVNQTLKDIEILIINDGSTDNSQYIIKEYADKYSNIKVINKQNEGLYKARNTGLENATGKYIGFVDSDDYIKHDMYEKLYSKAEETNADIVSCNYCIFYEKKNKLKNIDFSKSIKLLKHSNNKLTGAEEILFDTPVSWNKIFKKHFLIKNNIAFDSNIRIADDAYFNRLCFFNAKKIFYIPDFLYIYRKFRENSIRNKKNIKNFHDVFITSQKLINYVKNNNMLKFLPYCNYISIRSTYLIYLQIHNKYKNEFFNSMCALLEKNSINSIKQFCFPRREINLISLSYYRYLTVKHLNILIIKTIINKNRKVFDFIMRLREKLIVFFNI